MKEGKLSEKTKKIKKFPTLRVLGALVIVSTVCTASLAKYKTTTGGGVLSDMANPVALYEVEQRSLDPFADANYTANLTTVERTAITVSNTETVEGQKKISKVDLSYRFVFYVPTLFAQSAAIQLTTTETRDNVETEVEGDTIDVEVPITPLFVLSEFQNVGFTSDSNRYGGVYEEGVDGKYTYDTNTNTYHSQSATHVHSVKVEEEKRMSIYQHIFPTFMKGTDNPLVALLYSRTEEVSYQKITVSCNEHFSLPKNKETTHKYTFRVMPVKQMGPDVELPDAPTAPTETPTASTAIDKQFLIDWTELTKGLNDEQLRERLDVRDAENAHWEFAVNNKTITLTNVTDNKTYEDVDVGKEIKILKGEDTSGIEAPKTETVGEEIYHVYRIASGKYYPCRLNTIFTQTSDAD